MKIMGTAN